MWTVLAKKVAPVADLSGFASRRAASKKPSPRQLRNSQPRDDSVLLLEPADEIRRPTVPGESFLLSVLGAATSGYRGNVSPFRPREKEKKRRGIVQFVGEIMQGEFLRRRGKDYFPRYQRSPVRFDPVV